jgi:N6-L-threonylcarbamoyladenine synthase
VDILTTNFFKAAKALGVKSLAVAGGVAANSLLRRELERLAAENDCTLHIPPLNLCGDNAAMVGSQGYYEFLSGNTADMSLNATATMSIEG